jgi:LytS/YehU family sensor histidine kinase
VIYSVVVVVSGAGLVWLGFDLRTRPLVGPLLYLGGLTSAVFQACVNLLWRLNESNRRLAQTEAAAHTLAFQLRFQPHTIFNALNTIAALIPESPAQAEEATERLARLLRGILGAFEQPHWTLEHEFRILGDLLRIEALRFGTRLQYRLDLPEALASRPLPSLLLLPLVENALKHGFRPRVGPCQLEVRADETGIVVQDDGVGRGQSRHEGLGLKLVRERLAPVGGTMRWLDLEGAQGCALRIELSRHWEKDRA